MIRQLGCPTFFLTFSCADLQWNELISIISKLYRTPMSDDEINRLSYFERAVVNPQGKTKSSKVS